jgi:hypothetical protein
LCDCGYHQKSDYLKGINAPIQFGSSVVAKVSHFNIFQYVPYVWLKLLFKDIFDLSIMKVVLTICLIRERRKENTFIKLFWRKLKQQNILVRVKREQNGGYGVACPKISVGKISKILSSKLLITVVSILLSSFFQKVYQMPTIGSDRWAAQLKIESKNKQLCFPHLQRDLVYLIELERSK